MQGDLNKMSEKQLDRYVREFAGKQDLRDLGTLDIMGDAGFGVDGKQLECDSPDTPQGRGSGART